MAFAGKHVRLKRSDHTRSAWSDHDPNNLAGPGIHAPNPRNDPEIRVIWCLLRGGLNARTIVRVFGKAVRSVSLN